MAEYVIIDGLADDEDVASLSLRGLRIVGIEPESREDAIAALRGYAKERINEMGSDIEREPEYDSSFEIQDNVIMACLINSDEEGHRVAILMTVD